MNWRCSTASDSVACFALEGRDVYSPADSIFIFLLQLRRRATAFTHFSEGVVAGFCSYRSEYLSRWVCGYETSRSAGAKTVDSCIVESTQGLQSYRCETETGRFVCSALMTRPGKSPR